MNKKGASLAINMVIVIAMLLATFFVWKFGILDRLVGIIGSVGYQIDTTHMDICQGIGEKRKGTSLVGAGLTDLDGDELPDYICDTCVCRDGYGTRGDERDGKCWIFGNHVSDPASTADYFKQELYGSTASESILRCVHKTGTYSENNFCSTNNLAIEVSDTDNDFLPDVCDSDPENFNAGKALKCYEGPISVTGPDNKPQILGVVFSQKIENGLMEKTKQCVFAVCSPMNNKKYFDNKIYRANCPKIYCPNNIPDPGSIFEGITNSDLGSNSEDGCYCLGTIESKDKFIISAVNSCDRAKVI